MSGVGFGAGSCGRAPNAAVVVTTTAIQPASLTTPLTRETSCVALIPTRTTKEYPRSGRRHNSVRSSLLARGPPPRVLHGVGLVVPRLTSRPSIGDPRRRSSRHLVRALQRRG